MKNIIAASLLVIAFTAQANDTNPSIEKLDDGIEKLTNCYAHLKGCDAVQIQTSLLDALDETQRYLMRLSIEANTIKYAGLVEPTDELTTETNKIFWASSKAALPVNQFGFIMDFEKGDLTCFKDDAQEDKTIQCYETKKLGQYFEEARMKLSSILTKIDDRLSNNPVSTHYAGDYAEIKSLTEEALNTTELSKQAILKDLVPKV